jgi:hypothetical protein
MSWDKIIGPATFVYLVSLTATGIWWASDLSSRVTIAEAEVRASASAAERITRVETTLLGLDKQLTRIEDKLDRRPQ